jgi:hypothetical protein
MRRSRLKEVRSIVETVQALHDLKDDRAVGIMAGAFLEYTLGLAIRSRLREMTPNEIDSLLDNQGHGALATFSQKIWMGFALGVFGEEHRSDLLRIKEIRNHFAHAPEGIGFDDPEIKALCRKLKHPKRHPGDKPQRRPVSSRDRYLDSVLHFAHGLHVAGSRHFHRPPVSDLF